jgi:hypothetical protein
MMMKMLEAGGVPVVIDEIRKADEDNPRGYYEFEPVKKLRYDASWVGPSRGKVVKMVYALLYDLPDEFHYRIVFMRRNLDEVIASQNKMLRRNGQEDKIIDAAHVKALFEAELTKVECWLQAKDNFDVLYVDYNRLQNEPLAAVKEIDRFLGGGLDASAMAQVVEPQLYRNRS